MVDKKYLEEAKQMLSGGFENQKVQLNNSFNQNTQGLEGQKAGVNQNFDNQLEQNSRNVTKSQNQYNNNTLARGLGRSTIATSGMAGIKDSGNRVAGEVNQNRTDALGQIEAQKVQLQQALQDSLLGVTSKEESETLSLAQQLEGVAYERDWKTQQSEYEREQQALQFGYQKEQDKWDNDFALQKFEYQKQQDALARQLASRSGGGGGSGGSGGSSGSGKTDGASSDSEFENLLADYMKTGDAFVVQYAQRFKDREPTKYNSYMALYRAAQAKRKAQYTRREFADTTHTTKSGATYNIR